MAVAREAGDAIQASRGPAAGAPRCDLLRALRATARADSHPLKESLFRSLTETNDAARAAEALHRRIGRNRVSTLLIALYGIRALLVQGGLPRRSHPLLLVAVHANARAAVARVASWFPPSDARSASFGWRFAPMAIGRLVGLGLSARRVLQSLRVLHHFNLKHSFLVSCRTASTLALYALARRSLAANPPGAVVVSSDSNPEEIAFAAAARSLSIPTVFIAHALPGSNALALDFTLSLLEGEEALVARQQRGPVKGDVFLLGLEGVSKTMNSARLLRSNPVVGLFPPKVVSWAGLAACIRDIQTSIRPARIVVRWHPSMIEKPRLLDAHSATIITEMPRASSLLEAASQVDWAICDPSSNVHLPLLKVGVPTVSLRRIGIAVANDDDVYGIIGNGLVFPPLDSIRDLPTAEVVAFYSGDWPNRFRRYDVSYLSDPADREAVARARVARLSHHRVSSA